MIVFLRDHFRSFRRPAGKSVRSRVSPLCSNPHHKAERCSFVLRTSLRFIRREAAPNKKNVVDPPLRLPLLDMR
jgi:hypothetical protein